MRNLFAVAPYIDLEIHVRNLAVFPIEIIGVSGSFFIANIPCLQTITLKNAVPVIKHLHRIAFIIRQPISDATAKKIREYRDNKLPLPFSLVGCSLMVTNTKSKHKKQIVNFALNRIREDVTLVKL